MGGGAPPPLEMRVKMFELVQTNIFTPQRKRGGGTHWRFIAHDGRGWAWGGLIGWGRPGSRRRPGRRCWTSGGSTPRRRTGGRMPGWCTASHSGLSPSPSPPQTPPPPATAPPNPLYAFATDLGALSPALDRQGTVC